MDLTAQEKASLARILRSTKQWAWRRWLLLAVAVALLVVGSWTYRRSTREGMNMLSAAAKVSSQPLAALPQQLAFSFAVLAGRGFVFFCFGLFGIIWVISGWNGDPAHALLLRLMKEHDAGSDSGG
jgi:hypothetical protein